MASTIALTRSPFFKTSEGCLTRFVQLRLLTWTRPSMPSSISTKAPKSVRLRTRPSTVMPTGNFSCSESQGFDASWRMPREMRRSVGFTLSTTHSTWSPTLTSFECDEGSVVGDTDDASGDVRARRITVLGVEPRIGRELLESQRDALFIFVVLENLDLNLIADVDQVLGVSQA